MGWTWEVEAWVALDETGYQDMTIYTGESVIAAIRAMRAARREGIGCIRLTWRPS